MHDETVDRTTDGPRKRWGTDLCRNQKAGRGQEERPRLRRNAHPDLRGNPRHDAPQRVAQLPPQRRRGGGPGGGGNAGQVGADAPGVPDLRGKGGQGGAGRSAGRFDLQRRKPLPGQHAAVRR